jgi:hypothetical protein
MLFCCYFCVFGLYGETFLNSTLSLNTLENIQIHEGAMCN